MHILHRILLASLLVALVASASSAGTISIVSDDFKGVEIGYQHRHAFYDDVDDPDDSDIERSALILFGSVVMSGASGIPGFHYGGEFEAYCVDIIGAFLGEGVVDASAASMTTWPSGHSVGVPGAGGKAAWLYNEYNEVIQGHAPDHELNFGPLGPATADVARTALAVSIWEVLYEPTGPYDVTSGDFMLWCDSTGANDCEPGEVVALATAFLGSLGTNTSDAVWLKLATSSQNVQDFMGPASVQSVPELSSLAFLGVGLLTLVIPRRRAAC